MTKLILAALRRARANAVKTARMHGTPIIYLRDGKVVSEPPEQSARPHRIMKASTAAMPPEDKGARRLVMIPFSYSMRAAKILLRR